MPSSRAGQAELGRVRFSTPRPRLEHEVDALVASGPVWQHAQRRNLVGQHAGLFGTLAPGRVGDAFARVLVAAGRHVKAVHEAGAGTLDQEQLPGAAAAAPEQHVNHHRESVPILCVGTHRHPVKLAQQCYRGAVKALEQTSHAVTTEAVCRRVEEASINAWPAMQQMLLDGWLLRFAQGFTKRANSVIPLYPGDRPAADKVRFCENVYARERLKCIFRLSSIGSHDGLDALLAERGYRHLDPTEVMAASLHGGSLPSPRLRLLSSARWLDAYGTLTGMSATARKLHAAILRGIPLPCGYAVIGTADEPLACGLAVLEDDLVGLFDVVTAPSARRRGHARELVSSLLAWAQSQGATVAYLQMVADNHPARGLYQALGFEVLYRYWYRVSD